MAKETEEFTLYAIDGDYEIRSTAKYKPFITKPRVNTYVAIEDKPHYFTVMLLGKKTKIKKVENEGRVFMTEEALRVELRAMRQRMIDTLQGLLTSISEDRDVHISPQPSEEREINL